VLLFGPGYGECILVHLGGGNWLLVDSCIDQRSGEQPALEYLGRIGMDPAACVRLIVATHWHDDHVRGLARVVARCREARFACSAALRAREAPMAESPASSAARGVSPPTHVLLDPRPVAKAKPRAPFGRRLRRR
jgi:glyoxylase-like metal-dependent hydrolase (beta-lactamase superfamily II)